LPSGDRVLGMRLNPLNFAWAVSRASPTLIKRFENFKQIHIANSKP